MHAIISFITQQRRLTCGVGTLVEFDITTGLDGIGIPGPLETWAEPGVTEGGRAPELTGPIPGLDYFKMKIWRKHGNVSN